MAMKRMEFSWHLYVFLIHFKSNVCLLWKTPRMVFKISNKVSLGNSDVIRKTLSNLANAGDLYWPKFYMNNQGLFGRCLGNYNYASIILHGAFR